MKSLNFIVLFSGVKQDVFVRNNAGNILVGKVWPGNVCLHRNGLIFVCFLHRQYFQIFSKIRQSHGGLVKHSNGTILLHWMVIGLT